MTDPLSPIGEPSRALVAVRADTAAFQRDVTAMRGALEQSLGAGAEKAGRSIEIALLRATQSGKSGFDGLKGVALTALAEIAAAALGVGLNGALGSSGKAGGGGIAGTLVSALTGLLTGAPGRATGGPVSPGRAYMVGERGPELFVPTASGRVAPMVPGAPLRDVRVSITVNAAADAAPAMLAQSSRQVARTVRAALTRAG